MGSLGRLETLGAQLAGLANGRPHVEHPPEDDAFKAQVWQVLQDTVLPGIHRDGGNLELRSVAGGIARVSMEGSCRSCPSSTVTLKMGVERVLKERFPGRISHVESV